MVQEVESVVQEVESVVQEVESVVLKRKIYDQMLEWKKLSEGNLKTG